MSTSNTGSETVLVVDDESSVREYVRRVLTGRGYQVLVVATPDEALALAQERPEPIHLLMSDVMLPDMSVGTLADRLRGGRPDMAVIFMSGYSKDEIRGKVDPAMPFLEKPFTSATLTHIVRTALEHNQQA